MGILESIQEDLATWLEAIGIPESEAKNISHRFPAYFRVALIEEWREHTEYRRLKSTIDSPFVHAERRAQAWEAYRAHLKKQVAEPVFGETVSLDQIYVWPRAFVQIPTDEESEGDQTRSVRTSAPGIGAMRSRTGVERRVSWLRESVLEWLEEDDESDDIRIIRGDPGTGKSSFSKMLAAQIVGREDYSVVLVPLHRIDATKKLTEAIREFVSAPRHPLDGFDPFEEAPLLLILDGLDELSERGREGANLAREFVREVDRSLRSLNQEDVSVRVLLSGRKIAADAGARVLRDPGKVFNLMSFVPKGESDIYEDPENLAFVGQEPIDQRDEWWQKYGEASGSDYESGMPSHFRRGRLDDITAQPLLSHLVALAYEDEEASFSEDASPNALYSELLGGVYRRKYGSGPLPGTNVLSGMTKEEQKRSFVRVLEEIAMDVWVGDGRTTTVVSIEDRCREEGLLDRFDAVRERLGTGISRLLTTFYFREAAQGQDTFEFTHKTFAEYLTARRIVRTVEEIHDERRRNRERGGSYGHDLEDALRIWAKTCGPSAMDGDVFEFFADEIRIRNEERDCAESWKETFAELIRYVLREGMPIHNLDEALDYRTEKEWARNAEEALLAVVHACRLALLDRVAEDDREAGLHAVSVLDDLPESAAGDWIQRLQTPPSEHWRSLYRGFLQSVVWESSDLSGSILYGANLQRTNLREAELSGTGLLYGNLERVDLTGADLTEADLRKANLHGADLLGANFQRADLRVTNLREADLQGTDFHGTNLRGANLRGVDLRMTDLGEADLRETDLRETVFREADLPNMDFRKANLEHADLRESNLPGADFRKANLTHVNLQRANLREADFRRKESSEAKVQELELSEWEVQELELPEAGVGGLQLSEPFFPGAFHKTDLRRKDFLKRLQIELRMGSIWANTGATLRRANLKGANLEQANLRSTDLLGVNFREANLQGANLQGANLQGANLQGANLRGANLRGANLELSNVKGADLREAQCEGASFGDVETDSNTRMSRDLQSRID